MSLIGFAVSIGGKNPIFLSGSHNFGAKNTNSLDRKRFSANSSTKSFSLFHMSALQATAWSSKYKISLAVTGT